MIIRFLLTASLSVMVLAAACGGGEASTANAPNVPEALNHFEVGFALYEKGQLEEAIVEYDKAIRLDPQLAKAYTNRGSAYGSLGQEQRALQDFNEAIILDPQDAIAYNGRGAAYSELGKFEKAIKDLDQAIRLDPRTPSPTTTGDFPSTT